MDAWLKCQLLLQSGLKPPAGVPGCYFCRVESSVQSVSLLPLPVRTAGSCLG